MKDFLDANVIKIIITVVIIVLFQIISYVLNRLIKNYSGLTSVNRARTLLIKKIVNLIITIFLIIILLTLWGVNPQNLLIALSSVFAVIGVALFAQWSILSNITAGLVLFFSQQLRIGDTITVLDKDFPVTAKVEDIRAFYIYLRGEDKQLYIYPNNLLLQRGISIVYAKKKLKEVPKTE